MQVSPSELYRELQRTTALCSSPDTSRFSELKITLL